MKLLADECCSVEMVNSLRSAGHDVRYVFEDNRGASDEEILSLSISEDRILITDDKDFGELVYRFQHDVLGIILLRFDISEKENKFRRLLDLLDGQPEKLENSFVVLETRKIRYRPLK